MNDMAKVAQMVTNLQNVDQSMAVEAEAKAVTAVLAKPIIRIPLDLMLVLDCKKTTANKLAAHPRFANTFTVARQRFCKTQDFLACLPDLQSDND